MSANKTLTRSPERQMAKAVKVYAILAWLCTIFSVLWLASIIFLEDVCKFVYWPLSVSLLLKLYGILGLLIALLSFHMRDSAKQHYELWKLVKNKGSE